MSEREMLFQKKIYSELHYHHSKYLKRFHIKNTLQLRFESSQKQSIIKLSDKIKRKKMYYFNDTLKIDL